MNADAKAAVRKGGERERIVDFRRSRVIQAECIRLSDWQTARLGNLEVQRKIRSLGKVFVEKSVEVVVVAGGQRPAVLHELRRRQAGLCAGLLERFGLRAVAIGPVQELLPKRPEFFRKHAVLELLGPG